MTKQCEQIDMHGNRYDLHKLAGVVEQTADGEFVAFHARKS